MGYDPARLSRPGSGRYRLSSMNDEGHRTVLPMTIPLPSPTSGPTSISGPTPEPSLEDAAAAALARALAHPVRIRILRILGGRGECYCGDLCTEFSLAQSTISQHLKILREAGLVRATPCGSAVGYCVDQDRLSAFVGWTSTLIDPSHVESLP